MRIVEYCGIPVKRQKKVYRKWWGGYDIQVTFYDRPPILVSPADWQTNSKNRYFDDPTVRRCEVVRKNYVAH